MGAEVAAVNTADLDAAVRNTVFMPDSGSNPNYSYLVVLNELNDKLQTVFEDAILSARAGYWLHSFFYTTTGAANYRIPPRACVQGVEKIEYATTLAGPYIAIDEIAISVAQDYSGSVSGTPLVYTFQSDFVTLIPTPPAGSTLKITYYARPSRLVPQQSLLIGGATVRGQISSINTSNRTVVVNAIPNDMSPAFGGVSVAAGTPMTSGVQLIDIVHPDGWHETTLMGATQTFSGTTITIGGTDDLSGVLVGDFVRVADQSDWPCLPDDFHRVLADATATKILIELGMQAKSDGLALNNGNDMVRFKSMIMPRSRSQPKTIPIVRRSRGSTGFPYGWRFS
jgi:hypothetical protein